MNNLNLLTKKQVASLMKVSEKTVGRMVKSGKIKTVRIGEGRGAIRFRETDIEEYLALCVCESTEDDFGLENF